MRSLSFLGAAASAAAILLSSVVGCSDSDTSGTAGAGGSRGGANVDELFEPGPYEVGYRELAITYSAVASGDDRELVLRVWYPAQPDSGAEQARYALSNEFIELDLASGIALDGPPVNEESGFPFVIYSHGNGGEGMLGYPYGELMASHGWILVAPNHTGNTAFDLLGEPDPLTRSALDRPNDVTSIIDEFESGLSGDDLAGKADTSAVFMFGHSFGGYTSFALGGANVDVDAANADCDGASSSPSCDVFADPNAEAAYGAGFLDSRIVALAPQAPSIALLAEGQITSVDLPTMLMSGRLDQTTPQDQDAAPAWAELDGPDDIWVEMPLGAHFTFITICYDIDPTVVSLFQPDAPEDGCGPEFIDAQEAIPVLAAYVLAFGRRHVLGESEWNEVLEGPPLGREGDFEITLGE